MIQSTVQMDHLTVEDKVNTLRHNNVQATVGFVKTKDERMIPVTYPPNLVEPISLNEKKDIMDRMYSTYFATTLHTCRKIDYCYLSGTSCDEESDDYFSKRFKGARHINCHHMYGVVLYNKKYEKRFNYLNAVSEFEGRVILNHSLQGKTLKIKRSSGDIEEYFIEEDNPLFINSNDEVVMNILVDKDNYLVKTVGLEDIISKRSGNTYCGFISQNPEIFDENFVLEIGIEKLDVDWFDESREEWKTMVSDTLNKIENFKYKFYEY